jgi:hypothetical protein
MQSVVRVVRTREIGQLLSLDAVESCATCSAEAVAVAQDQFLALAYWWLSPGLRAAIGTGTYIEGKQNETRGSCSVRFRFANPYVERLSHGMLLMIQHHLAGGTHYQLQLPDRDLGKNLGDSALSAAIAKCQAQCEEAVQPYRVPGRQSISLASELNDPSLLAIQRAAEQVVRGVLEACRVNGA